MAQGLLADRRVVVAYAVGVLLGGANAVGVSFTVQELAPFWGASLRFLAAAVLLVALALAARRPFPRGRTLVGALLYGALGFGGAYAFAYLAIRDLGPGFAQVVLAIVPLVTFLFAVAHRQERFRWEGLAGAVLAAVGIGVAARGEFGTVSLGSILVVVAGAACIAEASIVVKRFPGGDPLAVNAVAMVTGAAMLLALSWTVGEPWRVPQRTETWAALAYLVLFGSVVVFVIYLFVLAHWPASVSAYQFVLLPFVTVALAAILQDAPVTPALVLGGAVVVLGVYVGAFWRRGTPAPRGPGAA